mmetsp:Transcript_42985/g.112996  ORF Transcript_42985/g.112996 Transcript_42985/m.112996 type:complete len:273 (+) Transcript_42985:248-1066(+)
MLLSSPKIAWAANVKTTTLRASWRRIFCNLCNSRDAIAAPMHARASFSDGKRGPSMAAFWHHGWSAAPAADGRASESNKADMKSNAAADIRAAVPAANFPRTTDGRRPVIMTWARTPTAQTSLVCDTSGAAAGTHDVLAIPAAVLDILLVETSFTVAVRRSGKEYKTVSGLTPPWARSCSWTCLRAASTCTITVRTSLSTAGSSASAERTGAPDKHSITAQIRLVSSQTSTSFTMLWCRRRACSWKASRSGSSGDTRAFSYTFTTRAALVSA